MFGSYANRNDLLRDLGFGSYEEYLKSDLWKRIRKVVMAKKPQCAACLAGAYQIHHTSYTRKALLGQSLLPLVPICGDCHKAIEFDRDGSKRTLHEANQELTRLVRLKRRKYRRPRVCSICHYEWYKHGGCPRCRAKRKAFR